MSTDRRDINSATIPMKEDENEDILKQLGLADSPSAKSVIDAAVVKTEDVPTFLEKADSLRRRRRRTIDVGQPLNEIDKSEKHEENATDDGKISGDTNLTKKVVELQRELRRSSSNNNDVIQAHQKSIEDYNKKVLELKDLLSTEKKKVEDLERNMTDMSQKWKDDVVIYRPNWDKEKIRNENDHKISEINSKHLQDIQNYKKEMESILSLKDMYSKAEIATKALSNLENILKENLQTQNELQNLMDSLQESINAYKCREEDLKRQISLEREYLQTKINEILKDKAAYDKRMQDDSLEVEKIKEEFRKEKKLLLEDIQREKSELSMEKNRMRIEAERLRELEAETKRRIAILESQSQSDLQNAERERSKIDQEKSEILREKSILGAERDRLKHLKDAIDIESEQLKINKQSFESMYAAAFDSRREAQREKREADLLNQKNMKLLQELEQKDHLINMKERELRKTQKKIQKDRLAILQSSSKINMLENENEKSVEDYNIENQFHISPNSKHDAFDIQPNKNYPRPQYIQPLKSISNQGQIKNALKYLAYDQGHNDILSQQKYLTQLKQ
ncbi:hypothetical protein ROZALSC1DRAFT_26987 [Rozella allomycis CSF55]|uniref:Uncharacterized protein n=1 Tax=Rozella allomycis (strain CSF55) TaxID=988480 RepID=A0A4P9YPZ6_ROZAC|nr:hypothetical protein ROZALSC1DRAFT_26987 [Rozella allomycis CSF55]